ncbi:unnamed protein product, partial [Bubo scandiacus]
ELEQLWGKQVTATDTELERVRWDFVLAKLKYEHEIMKSKGFMKREWSRFINR